MNLPFAALSGSSRLPGQREGRSRPWVLAGARQPRVDARAAGACPADAHDADVRAACCVLIVLNAAGECCVDADAEC